MPTLHTGVDGCGEENMFPPPQLNPEPSSPLTVPRYTGPQPSSSGTPAQGPGSPHS